MELRFRHVQPGDVEQELTQQDQFNTDSVPLAATLIRESIQNSSDAKVGPGPARVVISYRNPDRLLADYWQSILGPLKPHMKMCEVDFHGPIDCPDFLVIEDFGTTGLTGRFDVRDDENFNDFWRRVGRSHKPVGKSGSWGLGKLVFPVSSRVRTFFGLTIRHDDLTRQLLMGQTVLRTHHVDDAHYVPHGFFAEHQGNGFQKPILDKGSISQFSAAVGFARAGEPGLSIAIPFPRDNLIIDEMIPLIIENYFFPILTGKLCVQVEDTEVSSATFNHVASHHGSGSLSDGHLVTFIRQIDSTQQKSPTLTLSDKWASNMETAIGQIDLLKLRESYDGGALIHVRAPLTLRQKDNKSVDGSFDLFLKRADAEVPQSALRPLFVRGSITVPNEEANFRNRRAFGALIASEENVSQFLRDAENPAHTNWNGNAEKLTAKWKAASLRLRDIRKSLSQLHQLLDQSVARIDPDALKSILHIKDHSAPPRTPINPTVRAPSIPALIPSPKAFEITKRAGGFVLKAAAGISSSELPMQISLQAAYDLPSGNPLKKHSPYDFNFRIGTDLKIKTKGANYSALAPNKMLIDVRELDFSVEITGFDKNRDLVVAVSRVDHEAAI